VYLGGLAFNCVQEELKKGGGVTGGGPFDWLYDKAYPPKESVVHSEMTLGYPATGGAEGGFFGLFGATKEEPHATIPPRNPAPNCVHVLDHTKGRITVLKWPVSLPVDKRQSWYDAHKQTVASCSDLNIAGEYDGRITNATSFSDEW
jgi:hypothetical protein